MTREDMYLLGCLFAVNRLIEKGSSSFSVKVNGKWEKIPWDEVKKWIEKQYGIEPTGTESEDVPDTNNGNVYRCSCGYGWDKSKVVRHHFCPNCGAKVAEGSNKE